MNELLELVKPEKLLLIKQFRLGTPTVKEVCTEKGIDFYSVGEKVLLS